MQAGELFAEVLEDRRSRGPLFFCIVQRIGSPEVLFLGQFNSQSEATLGGTQFMSDYAHRHPPPNTPRHKAGNNMGHHNELRLRIESVNGSPINDYRIRDGLVEVRVLDSRGRPYTDSTSNWRALDRNEIQLHHVLGTVVSQWLRVRLDSEVFELDKAA